MLGITGSGDGSKGWCWWACEPAVVVSHDNGVMVVVVQKGDGYARVLRSDEARWRYTVVVMGGGRRCELGEHRSKRLKSVAMVVYGGVRRRQTATEGECGLSQVREEEATMVMEEHMVDYDGRNGVPNE
ncbi:hypothetical protein L1987_54654 [Smallanthus sonchifolius]|uniref:Uncharacterized protein n=1 Tax=Smallanthus sonchifolius TaxID=185202 RepID=A0ACB9E7Q0_9ASTR|nr:hypothetical protein L1987_54654 [Smallanthus sonchifolius]